MLTRQSRLGRAVGCELFPLANASEEENSRSVDSIPPQAILDCHVKHTIPRASLVEGLSRWQLFPTLGQPAKPFEMLGAHPNVCLVHQEPALFSVCIDQGPNVLPVVVENFRACSFQQ